MQFLYHISKDFYFLDNQIVRLNNDDLTRIEYFSWRPNKRLDNFDNIFCSYFKRESTIPHEIRKTYNIEGYYKLLKQHNINETHDNLFYSMNKSFIISYMNEIKNLCMNLLDSGLYYDKGYDLPFKIIIESEKYKLNLDEKLLNKNNKLGFHPYTATYRLSCENGYFPIYNLKKEDRVHIKPHNDLFFEFDYNAAEFRIFLGSIGVDTQHINDLYEENKSLFNASTREEAKQKYFETFYGGYYESNSKIGKLMKSLINQVYNGVFITTPFGNRIYCEDLKNVASYYCQTCCSLMVYEKSLEIIDFIKKNDLKTRFAFTYHDAIILDLVENEFEILKPLLQNLINTRFGKLLGKSKIGYNYGEMIGVEV